MEKRKIPIVDENDNIIEFKDRREVKINDVYRATGLWIENKKGEILMAQRSFSKKNSPGKWGPAVSGTVEYGETYDSNIIKEAQEEIGLVGQEFEKIGKIRITGQHNYFAMWYLAHLDRKIDEFKIDPIEVEDIKWFRKEKLLEMLEKRPQDMVDGIEQSRKLLNI